MNYKKLINEIVLYIHLSIAVFLASTINAIGTTNNPAIIRGTLPYTMADDTLRLSLWEHKVSARRYNRIFLSKEIIAIVGKDGSFKFSVPISKAIVYFSLTSDMKKQLWREVVIYRNGITTDASKTIEVPVLNLNNFILEPDDNVHITLNGSGLRFSGQGSGRFSCLEELHQAKQAIDNLGFAIEGDSAAIGMKIRYIKKAEDAELVALESHKNKLTKLAYDVIKTDIVAGAAHRAYSISAYFYWTENEKREGTFEFYRKHLLDKMLPLKDSVSQEALGLSTYFPLLVQKRIQSNVDYAYWRSVSRSDYSYEENRKRKKNALLSELEDLENGLLKDKLYTMFCFDALKTSSQPEIEGYLHGALKVMEDSTLKVVIERYQNDFSRGQTAYNFTMEDVGGKTVQLSDFRGKVVFVDMWFTGCGACKSVAKAMRDKVDPYFKDNKDVILLSISIDENKRMWMNSIAKDAERDPELSYQWPGAHFSGDKTIYLRTLNGSEDPFIKKYVTLGYPTLMLIDREGKIFAFSAQRPDGGREQLLIDQINEALKVSVKK